MYVRNYLSQAVNFVSWSAALSTTTPRSPSGWSAKQTLCSSSKWNGSLSTAGLPLCIGKASILQTASLAEIHLQETNLGRGDSRPEQQHLL